MDEEAAVMDCPSCSCGNRDGAKFCDECGAGLNRTTKDWHTRVVTLRATKDLSERCFATLRMTVPQSPMRKCTNVICSDLGTPPRNTERLTRQKKEGYEQPCLHNRSRADPYSPTSSVCYRWLTEGFDTEDLQEAKTLLDELSYRVIAPGNGYAR